MTDNVVLVACGSVVALLAWAAVSSSVHEREKWENFSLINECRITQKKQGSSTYTLGADGNLHTVSVPSQTGWLCTDGITYWRND